MTKDQNPKREKKSETLEVRLPYSVKRAFMKATHRKGETASEAVRDFIDQYLEEARQAKRKSTLQEMMMTIDNNRKKTAALLTGLAATAFTFGALPSAADDAVFSRLDKNGDGVISVGEIGHQDEAIITALDRDGSGDVSSDEFQSKATIVRVERDTIEPSAEGDVRIIEVKETEFDFSDPERIEIAVRKAITEVSGDTTEVEMDAMIEKILAELKTHE